MQVTVFVRPRQKLPDPAQQSGPWQLTYSEYLALYGADPNDLAKIERFARQFKLVVAERNEAQRSVKLTGSVASFNEAFKIELYRYESPDGAYRGYEGAIRIPQSMTGVIEGVFGIDDRPAVRPPG